MDLHLLEDGVGNQVGLEFEVERVVVVPPGEVIGVDVEQQSEYFGEDVAPDDGLEGESPDDIDALEGVFGRDVSIGDSGDHCYTEVHDIGVHEVPWQEGHLVERPAVVNPNDVGSVGAIVVGLVDVQTDLVEKDAHVVRIEVRVDDELDDEENGVGDDVQLGHSLQITDYVAHRVQLHKECQFDPVGVDVVHCQRDDDADQGQQVQPQLQPHVFLVDDRDILDQQTLVVECLEGRDQDVDEKDDDECDVQAEQVGQLVLPEGLSEPENQSYLDDIVDDD